MLIGALHGIRLLRQNTNTVSRKSNLEFSSEYNSINSNAIHKSFIFLD